MYQILFRLVYCNMTQPNYLTKLLWDLWKHTAPIIRLPEMPAVEVHLLAGDSKPGGAGEASVPPVAPALASAIHAATGRRPRRLPLSADGYRFI